MRLNRAIWLATVLACTLCSTMAHAATTAGWSLESLMADLAQRRSGEARFVETKYLSTLKVPLVVEGQLHYHYPDSMEKENLRPNLERYVVEGDSLEIYSDAKLKHRLSLADYPAMQGFMGSLIATMGGDLAALRKNFQVAFAGPREQWSLKLEPLDPELKKSIRLIEVRGQAEKVTYFEVRQHNGDRSVMRITPVVSG